MAIRDHATEWKPDILMADIAGYRVLCLDAPLYYESEKSEGIGRL